MKYVLEITPQRCAGVFSEHGKITHDISLLKKKPEDIALVVFTGGEDVWPGLYDEDSLDSTFYNKKRDEYEYGIFSLADDLNIPKVGICRGSQFLCVMAGGKLIQDMTGHGCIHRLETNDGQMMYCNSSHHQMQLPPSDAIPLAWCPDWLSRRYLNGNGENTEVDHEYEVVYYPNINAVGIQYHPEWSSASSECISYAKEIVQQYLFSEVYS